MIEFIKVFIPNYHTTKIMHSQYSNSLFKFTYSFYKKYYWGLILIIFSAICLGLTNSIDNFLKKILIDKLNNSQNENIWLIFGGLITVFSANHIGWRSLNLIEIKIAPIIKNQIIQYSFDYLHKQSFAFFQNNLTGSLAHNINNLAENIQVLVHKYSATFIRAFVQSIVVLIVMYFVHPIFSLIMLIWMIMFISISIIFLKKFRISSKEYAASAAKTSGKIVDSITNFLNVKLFANLKFEKQNLAVTLEELKKRFQQKNTLLLIINICQGISVIFLLSIVLFILIKLKMQNHITIGDFILVLGLFFHVSENIWWISEYIGLVNELIGKSNQSLQSIFEPIQIKDSPNAKNLIVNKGEIKFENLYFGYKNNYLLFNNQSITIPYGKKIGLVGYSGSGKSSFVNLILRLFEPNQGKILIDEQDIANCTQESLHKNIAVIPQDPLLFHRSLIDNIRYGKPEATESEIIEAAKQAYAHEFITKLPLQYESEVGERGIKLSGGQKQRIAIARAILKNAPILILDEATSALDSITELEIQNSLKLVMQNKTVIAIAHRLSTLLFMDEILVFDQGNIVQQGTHQDLLNQDGIYQKLWNTQTGGFLPE